MSDVRGFCSIVLHTHLPYVHHPEYEDFLEEDWLFEAMTETYLPLLGALRGLEHDGIPYRLAFSMTPPLVEMMRTESLRTKFEHWVDRRRELAGLEVERLADDAALLPCARHYVERFSTVRALWDEIDRDIPGAFRALQDRGSIEILASAATHGFLPLLGNDDAVRAQIRIGVEHYRRTFDREPRGFWLPECAWRPGLGELLRAEGVDWIVLDNHGLTTADPAPAAGTYRPIAVADGLCAFGRDEESGHQVWSSVLGYPGDPAYRELYRDLGFDGDYRHIRPFLKPDGVRRNLGLKYHRITGDVDLADKEPWNPEAARDRARLHAENFVDNRRKQIDHQAARLGEAPVVLCPYDTELFGHWWYEGPWFLEHVFRHAAAVADDLPYTFETPSAVLDAGGSRPRAHAHHCTWGAKGYSHVWLNEKNHWFWRYLHEMEDRMARQARAFPDPTPEQKRLLDQMARELLLAESSDWPFIVSMETSAYYAEQRFRNHVHRFFTIEDALEGAAYDPDELARVEKNDAIFPEIDHRAWVE